MQSAETSAGEIQSVSRLVIDLVLTWLIRVYLPSTSYNLVEATIPFQKVQAGKGGGRLGCY